jgi:hypothetical protein
VLLKSGDGAGFGARTVVVILVLESRNSQIFFSSSCDSRKIGQSGPRLMSARALRATAFAPPFSPPPVIGGGGAAGDLTSSGAEGDWSFVMSSACRLFLH